VARPQHAIILPGQDAAYHLANCPPALAQLNQNTRNAIVRHLPLELAHNYAEVVVQAVTATYENGTRRVRVLCLGNLPEVMPFCCKIFAAGGAIDIDDLPWRDIFAGDYGWSPDLIPLRDELRTLWSQRPIGQYVAW
jgi:hypothetical protein